jgi:hypothetical protein
MFNDRLAIRDLTRPRDGNPRFRSSDGLGEFGSAFVIERNGPGFAKHRADGLVRG